MTKLYSVTLIDLGTYTVTVPGESEADACSIAKTVLLEEATQLPPGVAIAKRELEAKAVPAELPLRLWNVHATYSVDFSLVVPASSHEEAELNAKRVYANSPFPFEHVIARDQVRWRYAEEVQS